MCRSLFADLGSFGYIPKSRWLHRAGAQFSALGGTSMLVSRVATQLTSPSVAQQYLMSLADDSHSDHGEMDFPEHLPFVSP